MLCSTGLTVYRDCKAMRHEHFTIWFIDQKPKCHIVKFVFLDLPWNTWMNIFAYRLTLAESSPYIQSDDNTTGFNRREGSS